MKPDIAFLHTAPVHEATFEALMKVAAPHLRTRHLVREDLLADARRTGADEPRLAARIRDAMHAAAQGAAVVVCTCSTIGGAAEGTEGDFTATRIDRAMADAAIGDGRPVLMVAAVESTLAPTRALLESSARNLNRHPKIEALLVKDAWPLFERGDTAAYIAKIVEAVTNADAKERVVVLAQATMAPAADHLAKQGITALSSPRLGVSSAIALLAHPARHSL